MNLERVFARFRASASLSHAGRTVRVSSDPTRAYHVARFQYRSERDLLGVLLDRLEPGDVFLDAGASVGVVSLFAKEAVGLGKAVAFEPDPRTYEVLRRNAHLNDGPLIAAHPVALLDETGRVPFHQPRDEGPSGLGRIEPDEGSFTVQAAELDRLVSEGVVLPPTVAKVDVEGSEARTLDGMEDTLVESVRLVFVETHPELSGDPGIAARVEGFLGERGFNAFSVPRPGRGQSLVIGERDVEP